MAGFGDGDAEVGGTVRLRALTMFDAQRMTLYGTVAGMIDAGFSFKEAADLLSVEFEASGDVASAQSSQIFFSAVDKTRAERSKKGSDALREAAASAFGAKFVCPEEMALLVSLAVAPRPEKVLEAASRLLELQGRTRAKAASGPMPRFAG